MADVSETERAQFSTEVAAATSPKTAELLVREVLKVQWDDLVTKSDLRGEVAGQRGEFADLRGEFAGLRGEFADLRTEFAVLEGEFADLRGAFSVLKSDFADLRDEMRTGFADIRADQDRRFQRQLVWLISAIASVAAFQTTLFLALV